MHLCGNSLKRLANCAQPARVRRSQVMNQTLVDFRKEVSESPELQAELQEKIKGGADLVELGRENGHDFSAEDVTAAFEELKDSEEEWTHRVRVVMGFRCLDRGCKLT